MESNEIRVMRTMAWARAKGELDSMRGTYWSNDCNPERFNNFDKAVDDFIKLVEDNGWQE